jgi:hypothetical protein
MPEFLYWLFNKEKVNKDTINRFYRVCKLLEDKDLPSKLYDELPRKLSISKIIKNRKIIKNFINFQIMLYHETYVERSLASNLKDQYSFVLNNSGLIFYIIAFFAYKRGYIITSLISLIGIFITPHIAAICYTNEFLQKFKLIHFIN